VVAEPLVFARSRLDVAANARDYLTAVAVESNRSGQYAQYLLVHRWSTVDRRMAALPAESAGKLIIEADGRVLEFKPLQPMPAALVRRDRVHRPADADVVSWAYDVDLATLAYLADSQQIRAACPTNHSTHPSRCGPTARGARRVRCTLSVAAQHPVSRQSTLAPGRRRTARPWDRRRHLAEDRPSATSSSPGIPRW
jgi:hypothetical protein